MSFEDRSASGSQGACDLFAEIIERTYVDDSWVRLSLEADLVNDEPSFNSLQFTVSEVENALLGLESSKGPSSDGTPLLILKNFASGFALLLCMVIGNVYLPR
jgi:hypothetical protein